MGDFGIKTELLSTNEQNTLAELKAELSHSDITFHRELDFDEMCKVGQILIDLYHRTNDSDGNHINFAIGGWLNQANERFGKDSGILIAQNIKPTPFNSCFISYNHRDENFAKGLYARLRATNIQVWYAPEDIKGGAKLHEQLNQAIHRHDKLLLVLSENSLSSEWVMTEIRKARKYEIEEKRRKLFPIRLVGMETIDDWECFDADTGKDLAIEVREYFIPDFSCWQNRDTFQASFSRLLDDLKAT